MQMHTYVTTVKALSLPAGTKTLHFSSLTEFFQWKEHEEEVTHTNYIYRRGPYCPKSGQQGKQFHAQVKWHSCVRMIWEANSDLHHQSHAQMSSVTLLCMLSRWKLSWG